MKKKLLAGILALALCSTNMPPQTIFAGEFTSGNPDVVSEEETLEIFTNEEQEAAGETDEDLSVFGSEEIPEFNDAPDEAMAAAENARIKEIDLINSNEVINGVYTISSAGDYKFTCSNQETSNRIVVGGENISAKANINIHLDNVNIKTSAGPALQIQSSVQAQVYIYLEGINNLNSEWKAALQKDNTAKLTIDNSPNTTGELIATGIFGAGIGGEQWKSSSDITIRGGSVTATSSFSAGIGGGSGGTGSNITIRGGSVTATSSFGAGIGGGQGNTGSNITISGGSVKATSSSGAGIGGGSNRGTGSDITIRGGSVTATSSFGAGIGGGSDGGTGSDITISGGSVTATSSFGAGIGGGFDGGTGSDITISGGSVKAQIDCTPHKNLDSSGKYDQNSSEVYLCTIPNANNEPILIDGNVWEPSNHTAVVPTNTNLYAWLTGENHTVKVGNNIIAYSFDNGTFTRTKANPDIKQFTFTPPSNLTYDGNPKEATISTKSGITDMGAITVKYFQGDAKLPGAPKDAGTYIVKIDIADSQNYNAAINLSDLASWTFTINPASEAPGYTTQTTIFVPWSCKKINDITKSLPTNWIWSSNVDPNQDLQVEKPITATAIYNGSDKGNYKKETITYTIIRNECEHKNTVGRYYSSPSCTSNGYSGDTYCNDCKRTIYYGSTIPAYGQDYDNGAITTEPTAETDGIITYTCKRCKHQDTKTLGKLGDGEPYIEGSFQKKGWDAVNDLIKASKEKDTISIIMNGARTLPASVLSGIKGKDISLNLDMENGFIWKINGTSITAEIPADTDLSVTNTAEYIPAALYSLISTNQNDFGFHLGRSGAFDFPAVLSVKADASCAGLMANLFWYDVENGVLQCIQTVTVGGAFERSIPYADFTLSKGQDYFIAFGTESLNGRVIHTDGSITDENGAYLRPADAKISSHSIDRNKLTVKLSKGCAGAQGYDFVISKKSNMLQTGKFSQTVSSTGKPQASFRYLAKGTWYVAARSWVLDAQGNKVYGSWTKIKKIKITVVTPQQPKIRNITVEGNTVTVTYTKCKNATGYEILLGTKYKTSAGEKYPVKKYVKRTEGKNTVTVTFTNVKQGTWYVTVRSWNRTSKNKSRVYSPYSTMKKFKTKK